MKKMHQFDQVFDSQRVYRILLEIFANPGRMRSIREFAEKMFGEQPELLAIGMTLLDNEVSFYTCGEEALADELLSLTLSREEPAEEADFLFVTDPERLADVIGKAKCGTLKDPQKSATLVVKLPKEEKKTLRLMGPGIKDVLEIAVPKSVNEALTLRDSQCYEYPEGIDFLFVTEDGEAFAMPRLVRKEEV